MNIRRYRAATMRAALEQAREELGADALVLETREVRDGGFLGIGARPMIELQVATNDTPASVRVVAETVNHQGNRTRNAVPGHLDILDEVPAWPEIEAREAALFGTEGRNDLTGRKGPEMPVSPSEKVELSVDAPRPKNRNRMRIGTHSFATLAAKTYAETAARNEGTESVNTITQAKQQIVTPVPVPQAKPVIEHELLSDKTEAVRPQQPVRADQTASEPRTQTTVAPRNEAKVLPEQRELISRELDKLRAELRTEMRAMTFSLSALARQPVVHEGVARDAQMAFDTTPEIFDSPYYETYLLLTQSGMAPALARQAVRAAFVGGLSEVRDANTVARAGLAGALPQLVRFADDPLSLLPGSEGAPAASVFIGPTGVGKTTTIAKLAARVVYRMRRRVELITLDTWRIAAAEQLKTFAEIIGVGCHVARSLEELDEMVSRMSRHAVLLVDTAGRSPLDLSDGSEFCDYLRRRQDVRKFLVVPATTHPIDAEAALAHFAVYGADRLVITKLDETARPGAAVSVAASAGLPLAYLGYGQRVPEDMERATPLTFARNVVGIRN